MVRPLRAGRNGVVEVTGSVRDRGDMVADRPHAAVRLTAQVQVLPAVNHAAGATPDLQPQQASGVDGGRVSENANSRRYASNRAGSPRASQDRSFRWK